MTFQSTFSFNFYFLPVFIINKVEQPLTSHKELHLGIYVFQTENMRFVHF